MLVLICICFIFAVRKHFFQKLYQVRKKKKQWKDKWEKKKEDKHFPLNSFAQIKYNSLLVMLKNINWDYLQIQSVFLCLFIFNHFTWWPLNFLFFTFLGGGLLNFCCQFFLFYFFNKSIQFGSDKSFPYVCSESQTNTCTYSYQF